MKTSLAASPIVPLATAGVVALLIVGTMTSSTTATAEQAEGPPAPEAPPAAAPPAAPGAVPGAPAAVINQSCNQNSCTATFPAVGSTTQLLGQPVTVNVLYTDGADVTVGNKTVVVSTTVAKRAGQYRVSVLQVEPAGGVTLQVKRR